MLSKETASTERLTDRSKVQLSPTYAKVEEVNLHSSYDEPGPESYLREALAAEAFKHAGVPAPAAKHVVLRQNGNFYGGVHPSSIPRVHMSPVHSVVSTCHPLIKYYAHMSPFHSLELSVLRKCIRRGFRGAPEFL